MTTNVRISIVIGAWIASACSGVVTDDGFIIGAAGGTVGTSGMDGNPGGGMLQPGGGAGSAASGSMPGSGGSASSGTGSGISGTGSITGMQGGTGSGVPSAGAAGSDSALFCAVQQLLRTKCQSCHGMPPIAGAFMPMMSYADLIAPARTNPAVRVADVSLSRMQNTALPMPPRPATAATSTEIAAFQSWLAAGLPSTCVPAGTGGNSGTGGNFGAGGSGNGGTTGVGGSVTTNPYATPVVCTSMTNYRSGNNATMRPGNACIDCHTRDEGPRFTIAGTVYPTAHEPNNCNGVNGQTQVVIIGATGTRLTLNVNSVGNFSSNAQVALPYQALVVRNGVERVMATAQRVGDCNTCHTQNGSSMAPGRIMAP